MSALRQTEQLGMMEWGDTSWTEPNFSRVVRTKNDNYVPGMISNFVPYNGPLTRKRKIWAYPHTAAAFVPSPRKHVLVQINSGRK